LQLILIVGQANKKKNKNKIITQSSIYNNKSLVKFTYKKTLKDLCKLNTSKTKII